MTFKPALLCALAFAFGMEAHAASRTFEFEITPTTDLSALASIGVTDPFARVTTTLVIDDQAPGFFQQEQTSEDGGLLRRTSYNYVSLLIEVGEVDFIAALSNGQTDRVTVNDGVTATQTFSPFDSFVIFSPTDTAQSWGTLTNVNININNRRNLGIFSSTALPTLSELEALVGDPRTQSSFSVQGVDEGGDSFILEGRVAGVTDPTAVVPAPAALPLTVFGILVLGLLSRRRRSSAV